MIRQPIIAGVDGSQESVRAASLAWRLARAMDAQCVLVHAVPNVWAPGGMAPLVNSGEVFDLVLSDLQKWLSRELGA
jgi:nucleotide-binding universal stress UspA family protein